MMPWPYPVFFAHRGGGSLAPENTLAAMRVGHARGYRAVEFDVKLSADGIAYLLHDATLERTTDGRGPAAGWTMAELAALDAGAWQGETFRGEPIPRFDAVMRYLGGAGMCANVEIKPIPGRETETGRAVAREADRLAVGQAVAPLLSSFSVDALRAAQAAAPDLPRGLLIDAWEPACDGLLRELQCVSFHCYHQSLDAERVARLHAQGLRVMVYTVNDPLRAQALLEWGVDGIFTDALDAMAASFPDRLA